MSEPAGAREEGGGVSSLARDLTGELACANCNYDLKGISIRDVCPECGLAVRATILAVVDPRAGELRPVVAPRLTGAALVAAPALAFLAVLCVWGLELTTLVARLGGAAVEAGFLRTASVWFLGLSAVSTLAMVRPVRGLHRRDVVRAAMGVVAFGAVVWLHAELLRAHGPMPVVARGEAIFEPDREIAVGRIGVAALSTLVLFAFRPNALRLAYRSVVLRTGRVDRQPMTALAAALGVAAVGDALAIFSDGMTGSTGDVSGWVASLLIAVGSFLFTVGLWGVVVDTWRVRRVIVRPVVGIGDVMGETPGGGS